MLALVEGAVGDALQKLGIVAEGSDMAPVDGVGLAVEVLVAQCSQPASAASISAFLAMKASRAVSVVLVGLAFGIVVLRLG